MSKFLALLALVVAAIAGPLHHESRPSPPSGFVSKGAAPASQTITFRVGLASSDMPGLESKVMSISTPGSSDFRQWLSADDVKSFVQPSSDTVAAFAQFAKDNNLKTSTVSPNGEWITFTTTVSQANKLFSADFQTFDHPALKHGPLTRTLAVTLPDALVGHIAAIHPTTSFETSNIRLTPLRSAAAPAKRAIDASCNSTITPTCLQEIYGIPTAPATQASNTLLVTAYEDEWAENADLSAFLTSFRPDIDPSTSFTVQTLDDGENPQGAGDAGTEADLDIEYTVGIATGVPTSFLTVGGFDFTQGLLDTTTFLASVDSPPSVMTTSYGGNEDTFTASMATAVCNGYMTLGARGISVVFASGDGGVRGGHDDPSQCADNTFIPVFPATCPFVTSVGSTLFVQPERAINFSSGGFSNIFPRPSYQDSAVATFLQTLPEDFAGVFNNSGRGFPDVSTQGWNFEVVVGGGTGLVGGTSASSPTFASVIALVNDQLVAAGSPVLGFLNPWLYSTASTAFTDITAGKNVGFTCPDSAVSFEATTGWDPVSGWGTPVFSALLAAASA